MVLMRNKKCYHHLELCSSISLFSFKTDIIHIHTHNSWMKKKKTLLHCCEEYIYIYIEDAEQFLLTWSKNQMKTETAKN